MNYVNSKIVDFDELCGKTISKIVDRGYELLIDCDDGDRFIMYHIQDCCEVVEICDITGDLEDLIGAKITLAEVRTSYCDEDGSNDTLCMWTFYELQTKDASVTIRWCGESNGWYSVGVDFIQVMM